MNFDVFISYSRKDYVDSSKNPIPGNIVTAIRKALDSAGIKYWIDEEGVSGGDKFAPMIASKIKQCKVFLFLSTFNSNASEWTSNEIATAHAYGKKIIPVKVDDSIYNESIILYIARLDFIDYAANPEAALSRICASINAYLDELKELEQKKIREKEERERQEIAKVKKEEELSRIHSRMEVVRDEREALLKEMMEAQAKMQTLEMRMSSAQKEYEDLREKENRLVDNDFQTRRTEALQTGSESVPLLPKPVAYPNTLKESFRQSKVYTALLLIGFIIFALVMGWVVYGGTRGDALKHYSSVLRWPWLYHCLAAVLLVFPLRGIIHLRQQKWTGMLEIMVGSVLALAVLFISNKLTGFSLSYSAAVKLFAAAMCFAAVVYLFMPMKIEGVSLCSRLQRVSKMDFSGWFKKPLIIPTLLGLLSVAVIVVFFFLSWL